MLPMTMMLMLLLLTLLRTVLPPAPLRFGAADKAMQIPSSGCRRGRVETHCISGYKIGENRLNEVLV